MPLLPPSPASSLPPFPLYRREAACLPLLPSSTSPQQAACLPLLPSSASPQQAACLPSTYTVERQLACLSSPPPPLPSKQLACLSTPPLRLLSSPSQFVRPSGLAPGEGEDPHPTAAGATQYDGSGGGAAWVAALCWSPRTTSRMPMISASRPTPQRNARMAPMGLKKRIRPITSARMPITPITQPRCPICIKAPMPLKIAHAAIA